MTQTIKPPERPLLTIAIPTFNRAKYLRQSLSALFDQLVIQPTVELIVSDNGSTDETPGVIKEFEKRGLKLHYLRNDTNIGADANFLQCFNKANGKYLWLLGDDDIIVPGGLDKILPLLTTADYALVYLAPYSFRSDYLAEQTYDQYRRFAQAIPNGLPFIRRVGTMIGFISSMIVNREMCSLSDASYLDKFVGSNLMHLGWLLPALSKGGTSLIIWDRLVGARAGNSEGWGICQVFGNNLLDVLNNTLTDRPDIATLIINSTLANWLPFMIMQTRRSMAGPLNHEDVRTILEPRHKGNWRYWLYVFPVASFPYWASRMWYLATQLLNRIGRLLVLVFSYPKWHKNLMRRTNGGIHSHLLSTLRCFLM